MRVTIKAHQKPKSEVNPDYIIKSIRYIVSTDPTFSTTHLRSILKTPADQKMMEYSFEYDFPNEEDLYGYTVITYMNNEVEESTICKLNYLQPGFSYNNNIIATPTIYIKSKIANDLVPVKNLVLELSEFTMFQGHGNLHATTWRIFDSENRLILERFKDEFNTTTLIVPDDLLEENKLYRIEAIYYNNYDSESFPAVLLINTSGGFNSFSIDTSSIHFVNNGISTFTTRCNFVNFQHLRIDILNAENEFIVSDFISTSKKVTIPKMGLIAGERYYIRVYAVYRNNRGEIVNSNPLEFTTICIDIGAGKQYDQNYRYNNIISIISSDFYSLFVNKLNGVTEQMSNGDIPMYKVNSNSVEIKFFKLAKNTLIDTNRGFTISTVSTIASNTSVNVKLVKDLVTGLDRLIVMYNLTGNRIEIKSLIYTPGEYASVNTINVNTRIIENAKILTNSNPILDFKDDEFILAIVPLLDNKNMVVIKKDLSSVSYISNLYQAGSVPGNHISVFNLPDNNILKIASDMPTQRYGIYNIDTNNYVDKGILPAEMQNITGNANDNMWYGFDRQDGNTLLIPKFYNTNKFEIFLYNYYTNTMSKLIANKDMIVPGKYYDGLTTTIEKIMTIVMNDGSLILMLSGNKAGTDFKDIWKYI